MVLMSPPGLEHTRETKVQGSFHGFLKRLGSCSVLSELAGVVPDTQCQEKRGTSIEVLPLNQAQAGPVATICFDTSSQKLHNAHLILLYL